MEILLPVMAVILGGIIKGLTGFGYALVSTSLLAVFIPAQQAVAVMIIPLMAGNLEIILETNFEKLRESLEKFSGYILYLLVGTGTGMFFISSIPSRLLQVIVGFIAVTFSVSRLGFMEESFQKLGKICFKAWKPVIGISSGLIYGSSNIGVPVVTYLKSRNLSIQEFTGTLAAIILILSIYRIIIAQVTGIYTANSQILVSMFLTVPAVFAVRSGRFFSGKLPSEKVEKISILLIAVIGLKLLLPF